MQRQKPQHQVIIVLGDRPLVDGMHPEHAERCDRAVHLVKLHQLLKEEVPITVVLTGGVTRDGQDSEAILAERYCAGVLRSLGVDVLLEDSATTTSENILFSKALLERKGVRAVNVVVIARASQAFKTGIYLRGLWPEVSATIEKGIDLKPVWHRFLDYTLMPMLAWIDPYDRFWRMVRRRMSQMQIW